MLLATLRLFPTLMFNATSAATIETNIDYLSTHASALSHAGRGACSSFWWRVHQYSAFNKCVAYIITCLVRAASAKHLADA